MAVAKAISKSLPETGHRDIFQASHGIKPSHVWARLSHLTTLRNSDILQRFIPSISTRILNLPNRVHPINDLPKDDMLAVQMRGHSRSDEELGAVAVGTAVLKEELDTSSLDPNSLIT